TPDLPAAANSGQYLATAASKSSWPRSTSTSAPSANMVLVVEKTQVIVSRCHRRVRASSAQPPQRSSANSPSTVTAREAPRSRPLVSSSQKSCRSGSKRGVQKPSTVAVGSLMATAPEEVECHTDALFDPSCRYSSSQSLSRRYLAAFFARYTHVSPLL